MNRKWVWLGLPFVLGALMWGVKWRAEHPTPTKEDLGIRALMLKSSQVTASHNLSSFRYASEPLSKTEFAVLVDNFFLSPNQNVDPKPSSSNHVVHFDINYPSPKSKSAVSRVSIGINVRTMWGWMNVHRKNAREGYKLHPVTVKRWTRLLLDHSPMSRDLREHLNPHQSPHDLNQAGFDVTSHPKFNLAPRAAQSNNR